MKARDIMRRDPVVVMPEDGIARAAEHMRYERDACIPVVSDAKKRLLVGVITARDIVVRCVARHHGRHCLTRDHMTPLPLQTVGPDDSLDEIATRLAAGDVRRIPVISADGMLLGMVTEIDVHNALEGLGLLGHHAEAIPAYG